MSHHKQDFTSEFLLQGQFLGFAAEKGYKLKYLRLATPAGEQIIKIPKELRSSLYRTLVPQAWIQVAGYRKVCFKHETTKLKAYQILPIASGSELFQMSVDTLPAQVATPSAPAPSGCILVCQKSDCCKRGGRALVEALQTELSDRGLENQVKIKPTGCMKRCKAGPNLIMPDKTRYTKIQAPEVTDLLDKHFPCSAKAEAIELEATKPEAVTGVAV